MTKRQIKQLELPILADVNSNFATKSAPAGKTKSQLQQLDNSGFHKPATKEDQSIYQSISDSYFSDVIKHY